MYGTNSRTETLYAVGVFEHFVLENSLISLGNKTFKY